MQISKTIPMHLQTLFDNMDFISSAKPGSKVCFFSKTFVDSDSWSGAIFRFFQGEKQSTKGNSNIRECCEEAAQAYDQYFWFNTKFSESFINKQINKLI